ncbi:hypothetical protein OSB04_021006 [Centaurea solstitialis]|uniref:Uncharacterized protein n=1 Tax=Centaurea solstitialis TaxID=347529 RepID=A0AA38T140_9ASTR|nr:hypothetical protein OSB04_021006 [Centaurea solstitialis]
MEGKERKGKESYLAIVPPVKTSVTVKGGGGHGEGSYETKSRVSYGDKKSGSYRQSTTMKKKSSGEFQWKDGTSGTKYEYQKSSTVRIGNKSGYTEVYNERRVRKVSYNNDGGNDSDY